MSCRYWRLNDLFAAYTAAEVPRLFSGWENPQIAASSREISTPSNSWFLGLIWVASLNGISIGLAVFLHSTSVCTKHRHTDAQITLVIISVAIGRICCTHDGSLSLSPLDGVLPCQRCVARVYGHWLLLQAEWISMLTDCTSVTSELTTLSQVERGRPQGLLQWLDGRRDASITRWWSRLKSARATGPKKRRKSILQSIQKVSNCCQEFQRLPNLVS